MKSLEEIRKRDAESAATWFKEPAVGACGQAFIDRRWLLAENDRLRDNLSLAEEGLANYAQEVEQLKAALLKYGYHTGECSAGFPVSDHCACGFSDALRGSSGHPSSPGSES